MTDELKPCPFCGCAASFVKHSAGVPCTRGYDKWDAVACKHCRATVGACDRRFRERADAAAAWNRRVPHAQWRPIETAPKDGTEVLVGRAGLPEHSVSYPHEKGYVVLRKWTLGGGDSVQWNVDPCSAPTHWMPLPEYPPELLAD